MLGSDPAADGVELGYRIRISVPRIRIFDPRGRVARGRVRQDLERGIFQYGEVGGGSDDALHAQGVFLLGALGAGRVHGRSAAEVEGLRLQGGRVRIAAHFAAQGVQFVDEVAFGESADRGIAGHAREGVPARGDEKGGAPHARGDKRRFAPGMSAAHYDYIILCIHGLNGYYYSKLSTGL